MTLSKPLAVALLVPFTALTVYALADVGFIGVFEHQLASSGGWQVWVDLVIAIVLLLTWLIPDARRTGRNPWPFVVISLIAGSFGPLLYVALGPSAHRPTPGPSAP